MKKIYLTSIFLLGLLFIANAQIVNVAPGDSTLDAAIYQAAEAGSLSTTTFVLQRGGEYLVFDPINNEIDDVSYDLTIEAAAGDGEQPIIRPKFGNDRPFDLDGNDATVTLTDLFITGISADPEDIQDNHMIRLDGDNLIVAVDDCHIDGNYRSGFQIRNAGGSLTITNSIISNIVDPDPEDPRVGVSLRLQDDVAVTVENTSFYNAGDAAFSNNEGPLSNPVNIKNCTFANIGQSAIRLDKAVASVTNCMFANVGITGSEETLYVVSSDSLSAASVISNHTIFLSSGTTLPSTVENLNGTATTIADETTFLSEVVEFNNLPAGFDANNGWNTSSLDGDFGYAQTFMSYRGGTNASIIGDTSFEFEAPDPVVLAVAPGDSTLDAAIATAVMNGTAATTTFELQRGGEYLVRNPINNEMNNITFDLSIAAASGDGARPIIRPKFGNDRPFDLDGDQTVVTLTGLFITGISADPEDVQDNHMIRLDGDKMAVTLDDCHIDGNYRSGIQIRNDDGSLTITNSIISNIVDPDPEDPRVGVALRLQGDVAVSVENTSFYNAGDAGFSNNEGPLSAPVNIKNCTFANIGQSAVRLDKAVASVTDCMFANIGIAGSEETLYVVSSDSLSTASVISNHNIFLSSGITLPSTVENLNETATSIAEQTTFLNEVVEFNSLPVGLDATNGWNTSSLDGDFGYSQEFASYTGGTSSGIIGDTNWEFAPVDVPLGINNDLKSLNIYPNPANTYLAFRLNSNLRIQLVEVFTLSGVLVKTVNTKEIATVDELKINVSDLSRGLYLTRSTTDSGAILRNKFILE